jgi:uncharacterized protein (DUF433 family)
MDWREHIVSDENILLGKPTIKGTRISVEIILELFANGWTEPMILESYPPLSNENMKAAFQFLKESIRSEPCLPQETRQRYN